MELITLKREFEKTVDIASKIVSNNLALPVLQCVLIEVKDNRATIKSTNLELGVEVTIPAEIKEDGVVAIPASILLQTLKTIDDNQKMIIKTEEDSITITTNNDVIVIKTISPDDFPNIPKPETDIIYTINSKKLALGIKSVSGSASTSSIKPELSSVYIYHNDDNFIFVATDQFRLAEKKISFKSVDEVPSVIIPVKNAIELMNVLNMDDIDVELYIDENQYSVKINNIFITSRIINGSFPDYKVIIPKESSTEVILLKTDFSNTLKKMQIFADKFGKMTLDVDSEKSTFKTNAKNKNIGEVEDFPTATIEGMSIKTSFNYRYLLNSISSIQEDSVVLSFSEGKPLIIKGVGDSSFMYLVMPMNN